MFLIYVEFEAGLLTWVKLDEAIVFSSEIELQRRKQTCPKCIRKLIPILEYVEMLRVETPNIGTPSIGGCLQRTAMASAMKYPILLP